MKKQLEKIMDMPILGMSVVGFPVGGLFQMLQTIQIHNKLDKQW